MAWIVRSDGTLMHTGFTGTAIRWHPKRRCASILLTNRVHPRAGDSRIQAFRETFFSGVFD